MNMCENVYIVLGPWHSWYGQKVLRASKTRPSDLLPLVSPYLIVSQLAKQLSNFQLLN
jgi:uncharacterized RmlC-like cupin family protein